MDSMTIRPYHSEDCGELARLFYETVHTVNAADYTPEQLDAWATGKKSLDTWDRSFRANTTLVAEAGGQIVGFADMDDGGYLDHLFVHRDFQRRGLPRRCVRRWRRDAPACATPPMPLSRPARFSRTGATGWCGSSRWTAAGCFSRIL